jgi:predicted Na+-dependent transporter
VRRVQQQQRSSLVARDARRETRESRVLRKEQKLEERSIFGFLSIVSSAATLCSMYSQRGGKRGIVVESIYFLIVMLHSRILVGLNGRSSLQDKCVGFLVGSKNVTLGTVIPQFMLDPPKATKRNVMPEVPP